MGDLTSHLLMDAGGGIGEVVGEVTKTGWSFFLIS
jgi:hypothetical protein